MRRTTVRFAVLAFMATLAPASGAMAAEQSLREYKVQADETTMERLEEAGVDTGHSHLEGDPTVRSVMSIAATPAQASDLRAEGVELGAVQAVPGVKPDTGGDSPSPYYDVYRSYSEPGGIADEMRALAAANPQTTKLVRIGTSRLGKPILALKVTANARNVADGSRPAVLYSSVNHAREWIAAETGRRLMGYYVRNAARPEVADLLGRAELWFLPIQNPDGYDYTFTCGTGAQNRQCGRGGTDVDGTPLGIGTNRLWRKTLRDNNANGTFGDSGDGVDPNRNYPTSWNLDEEGASNTPSSGTYRGPAPYSEPENLAYDRLLRKVRPAAVVNYHSAAQLLLYPFGSITDVNSDDNAWFVSISGTDGDAAVDPYISQRSSDLYVTNGETTDHAYARYGAMAWTPELDECDTGGAANCNSGFVFPDDEGKVQGVFEKNLDFARNVAVTVTDERPDRPKNATDDESGYRVKQTPDIEPQTFGISYGREQLLEATARRVLGPVDFNLRVRTGPGGTARTIVLRGTPYRGGERYGDVRGRYYQRVRATVPDQFVQPPTDQDVPGTPAPTPRPLVEGDVVDVTVIAGSQRQRFSYVVGPLASTNDKRVLVLAAEDYKGVSPNAPGGYDTAPRYADDYVDALEAAGYEVEVYDTDSPPNGAPREGETTGSPVSRSVSALGVLDHFDAVVYETGDDLVPQDGATEGTNFRRPGATAGSLQGSLHVTTSGVRNTQALRDYVNDGGKLVIAGRNSQNLLSSTSTSLTTYSGYTWFQEPVFGFNYPAGQAGDDDRPGTAFFRELDVSNDFAQYFLGVAGRQGGYNGTTRGNPAVTVSYDGSAVEPEGAGGIFAGLTPFTPDAAAGNDPTETTAGVAAPKAKSPTRMRSLSSLNATTPGVQRPFRQERVELDYATADPATTADNVGGAAISTRDTMTFGFGLEQVSAPVREQLLSRTMAYLLPATTDGTAPVATFLRPPTGSQASPRDPVEIEVEAYDERGDLDRVELSVGGQVVGTDVTFPFQFNWTPAAADGGRTVTLTATAYDRAGNQRSAARTLSVVAPEALVESPLPVGRPAITGTPQAGQALTCVSGGFTNGPDTVTATWAIDGAQVASGDSYTPPADVVGRSLTCTSTGTNAAGSGDATSTPVVVGAAPTAGSQGPAGPTGPAGPAGPAGPKGDTGARGPRGRRGPAGSVRNVRVSCRLVARNRIRCQVRSTSAAKAKVAVRLIGSRKTVTKTGRKAFRVDLKTRGQIRRGAEVSVKVLAPARGTLRLRPSR